MMTRVRNEAEALALIREHPVVTVTPAGELPSIVKLVVGGPVKGSWWGHPKGKQIFRISSALDDNEDVLAVKLVDGKITFVHRILWPSLLRVVTDPGWRKSAASSLGREARKLLRQVEKDGEVHLDPILERAATKAARAALRAGKEEVEKWLLALSTSRHTESGRHEAVLISWKRWQKEAGARPADCTYEDAMARLKEACLGERTVLSSGQ